MDAGRRMRFGVPDEKWGEAVKAVVEADSSTTSAQDITDYVGGRIGRFKRPQIVEFTDALPRKDDGSVDREELSRLGICLIGHLNGSTPWFARRLVLVGVLFMGCLVHPIAHAVDQRELVAMPDMMRNHMLANADHLAALTRFYVPLFRRTR